MRQYRQMSSGTPVVIRHADVVQFQAAAHDFLMTAEAENNLILGIIDGLLAGRDVTPDGSGSSERPLLVTVGMQPVELVAVRTPPHKLQISRGTRRAAEELARFLATEKLPGTGGEAGTVGVFVEAWRRVTRQSIHEGMRLLIYQLRTVLAPISVPGKSREATLEDANLLAGWHDSFFAEIFPERSFASSQRVIEGLVRTHGIFVWEHGQVVSMAARVAVTPNGERIGLVYTPPEFRQNGYAGACVATLSQTVLDTGRSSCFLFTDRANPTSNSIYQRIGYEPVSEFDDYWFTRDD